MPYACCDRICDSPGCGKPAKLQCPTCIKLCLASSYFCDQVNIPIAQETNSSLKSTIGTLENDE